MISRLVSDSTIAFIRVLTALALWSATPAVVTARSASATVVPVVGTVGVAARVVPVSVA